MTRAALKSQDYVQDNFPPESREGRHARIAWVAEQAACLSANVNGPELEDFAARYGLAEFV